MPTQPDAAQKTLVLSGEFRLVVDGKKRVTVPARWRSSGLEDVYIIKSLERRCLVAMPQEVLHDMGEKAASQVSTIEDHQTFKDQFFAAALNCPVDSQGRMVLPDEFCQFAGIDKEAVLTGSGQKFDIWNPGAWQQKQQAAAAIYATTLKGLGL